MTKLRNVCSVIAFLVLHLLVLPIAAQNQTAELETPGFRFAVTADGGCELFDKKAQVAWGGDASARRLGQVTLNVEGKQRRIELKGAKLARNDRKLLLTFNPLSEQPTAALRVAIRSLPDGKTLEISYEADASLKLENISLLDQLLTVTDSAKGYVVVPVREGLLIPADSGIGFDHRFDTYAYEGCHMEMFGAVRNGAAVLVTWQDPYTAANVKSVTNQAPSTCRQRVTPSLVLRKSANTFQVQVLGKGDYVRIAQAYRQVAQGRGWLVTWKEKLKGHPERAKLFGAANIKLWSTLDRQMNEESTKEESSRVNWTFEEAAQVSEHMKHDLQLDKVLFTIGGWIHRGYDNQHPDILPTAPECGGDAAFADCARRVMSLGYLFCLHDNYQDIYRDSPSWNERYVMKIPDGTLARGGHWAGGLAFLTCSQMALELAERPQNLVAVRKLCDANSYFIDTTYAAGLQECFDPAHPLTRSDDMKWKQALSDYARQVFGVFGSECGREWAIPHSDFFEGLTGVSGTYYHDASLPAKLGATVVPLFELVYRDCIAMYGKYGYDPARAANYVLYHISLGRTLNYHSMPSHLYWHKTEPQTIQSPAVAAGQTAGDAALFTRAGGGRFIKNTYEVLSPLNELTAQMQMTQHEFLTADRKVQRSVFGTGAKAIETIVNTSPNQFVWTTHSGGKVVLPSFGFVVDSQTFAAFHALSWGGHNYDTPAVFSLRSLDGRPIARSKNLRVYHAFGSDEIRVGDKNLKVRREERLNVKESS